MGLSSMLTTTAFYGESRHSPTASPIWNSSKGRGGAMRDHPEEHQDRVEKVGRSLPPLLIRRPNRRKRADNEDKSAETSSIDHEPRTPHGQPAFQ